MGAVTQVRDQIQCIEILNVNSVAALVEAKAISGAVSTPA